MKHQELFSKVTDDLVAIMEAGANPWRKQWSASDTGAVFGQHRNAVTGRAYRGLNTLILNMAAHQHGYSSTGWMTPRQAMAAGLNIKGQKCTQITFWSKTTYTKKNAAGEDVESNGMFCKVYNVLNADQCEGDKSALKGIADSTPVVPMARHTLADAIETGMGVGISHGGNRAFYMPSFDRIQMPVLESFESEGAYCATLSHEAIHATGSKTRLDRDFSGRFGDDAYAFEELVAELGAAFVGAVTGHSNEVSNHASYLAGWVRVLKQDARAILTAASKAQAAADMVLKAIAADSDEEDMEEAA